MSSRQGSHAGRGFRYQDAVAAYLAVTSFSGTPGIGTVIPEGRDDLELRQAGHRVLAQVKSRRDHLGPFNSKVAAGYIEKMWASRALQPTDHFLLVLESDVGRRSSSATSTQPLSHYPGLIAELIRLPSFAVNAPRTEVLVLPNPRGDAVSALATRLSCAPLEAEVYVADLVGLAGILANENGMLQPERYRGITVSDIQQRIETIRPLLTSAVLDEALSAGTCSPVDFLTTDADPLFYLGVDAQPAHVAAGLVVERPELRSAVLEGLESRRNTLIQGPSGSGKSALLWEAAYASRHSVRWFQIHRLPSDSLPSLLRLAHAQRASADAPIGFIIDDVGRGFSAGWTALSDALRRVPGTLLLASIREEDKYVLEDHQKAAPISLRPDEALAARVWQELHDRGQTAWKAWREPWDRANGHLLEYTHVLTQGQRLSETLHAQVAARLNTPARHDELDVLRVVTCANAVGCAADLNLLPETLGKPETTVSFALRRLADEHLVRTGDTQVVGLHELRSQELLRLTHEFPPPSLTSTVAKTIRVVPTDQMARYLERMLGEAVNLDDTAVEAIATRIEASPTPRLLAAALTGLDIATAHRVVRDWLQTESAQQIPKAQRSLPAQFGIANIEPPDIQVKVPVQAAYRDFIKLRTAALADSLPIRLVHRLGLPRLQQLLAAATELKELRGCMAAFIGQPLAKPFVDAFASLTPALATSDFDEVVKTLRVARAFSRSVAVRWLERVGQDVMFERFREHMQWADRPSISPCNEGHLVRANLWCIVPELQADMNDSVVRVCDTLSALTPSADIFASDALGADGQVQMVNGLTLVTKRIPLEGLPPPELVRRNRAWMGALASQLARDSATEYLHRSVDALRTLVANLAPYLDGLLRKKQDLRALIGLNIVFEASKSLVAPNMAGPFENKGRSSRIVHILSGCANDVPERFEALPERAHAFIHWLDDLLKDVAIAQADEPWSLLGGGAPPELSEIAQLLEGIRALAGESAVRNKSPISTHFSNGVRKGLLLTKACAAAQQFRVSQLKQLQASLDAAICTPENGIRLFLLEDASVPAFWPPADILLMVPLETPNAFTQVTTESWETWRSLIDSSRRICVLPVKASFGMTKLALSGLDTILPAPDAAIQWCNRAGVSPLPTPTLDAFTDISNPLVEIDAIATYRHSKGELNASEAAHYEQTTARLEAARAKFELLDIPEDLKVLVREMAEKTLRGDLPLASSIAGSFRGETLPGLNLLGGTVQLLNMLDSEIATSDSGATVFNAERGS